MEYLLNVVWVVGVACALVGTTRLHQLGKLRCSLPVALGCAALIALVLFPAISMSDDVARAKLYDEAGSHPSASMTLRSLEDGGLLGVMLFGAAVLLALRLDWMASSPLRVALEIPISVRESRLRPCAVRPPPASFRLAVS